MVRASLEFSNICIHKGIFSIYVVIPVRVKKKSYYKKGMEDYDWTAMAIEQISMAYACTEHFDPYFS